MSDYTGRYRGTYFTPTIVLYKSLEELGLILTIANFLTFQNRRAKCVLLNEIAYIHRMVGKRSGKALLREEGKRHPQYLSRFHFALKADETLLCRSGKDRQQYGSDYVASDQSDQSEELLHVSHDFNDRSM